MPRRHHRKTDPLEHAMELALNPGAFISHHTAFSFMDDLDEVAKKIGNIIETNPDRAVALYETFLSACYEKADELDDSSGDFGQFVCDLIRGWIKAKQAAGADPGATAARLLAWMDDDPYGFCHDIEKDSAKVFNKAGLAAFEKQVRTRFDEAASAKPSAAGSLCESAEYVRRRWGEVLRTICLGQKKLASYIELAEETGLTPQDCHAIGSLLVSRRKPQEALEWVNRGIDLEKKIPHGTMAGYYLIRLKRDLLTKLGRGSEALADAWDEYRKHPSKHTYKDLMKFVSKAERSSWHDKAINAAGAADLYSLVELLLGANEIERLAVLVHSAKDAALERLSHYATEPAAKKLEKNHPDIAARLWRAQGMRIVNAKKSRYYDAAILAFERAMRCYEKAGLAAEWERTAAKIRAGHHRKSGFMPGFEALVAGHGPSRKPSFLERARARWMKPLKEEDR